MTRTLISVGAAVALLASPHVPTAKAYAKYALQLPNGDAVPDAPNIGHVDAAGLQGTNDFGKGWTKFGKGWTKAYCEADSDGDGFTNGQELGDPCCTWTPTNPGSLITEGISHPSDKTKTPTNAKLQAKCSSGGSSGTAATNGTTSGGTSAAGGTTGGAESPGTVHGMPEDTDEDLESVTLAPMSSAHRPLIAVGATIAASLLAVLLW